MYTEHNNEYEFPEWLRNDNLVVNFLGNWSVFFSSFILIAFVLFISNNYYL